MGRGQKLTKQESNTEVAVTQRFYVDRLVLTVDKSKCIGCDLCTSICPKDAAVRMKSEHGMIVTVDADKCVLCGACVPLCPTGAVTLTLNDHPVNVLLEKQGLPRLLPKIEVDGKKCPPDCTKCADACPRQAIKIESGHKITIDSDKCLRCPWCVDACDKHAITVNPMFMGSIRIDDTKCSEDCDLCVDACRTKAIRMENNKVRVDINHCVLCGACTNVCEDQAIDLRRTRVLCSEGFSSVWSSAVEKLLGPKGLSRDHDVRASRRVSELVKESRVD
jgi:4Fe-4S ferredoxin